MDFSSTKIRGFSFALALGALLPLASCARAQTQTQTPVTPPALAEKAVQTPDYLSVARLYADTLISQGRDRYGAQSSPLFAVTLNPELTLYKEVPPAPTGIRVSDRVIWGANPMHDQNLVQVLYALSRVTGDPNYGQGADDALRWFFEHCQSEATGLMAWGEHLGWDFRTERVTVKRGEDYPPDQFKPWQLQDDIHEFYRPWVLWDKSYQLAPAASAKFAQGLWEHQIYDSKTGQFNRHAGYSAHKPEKDAEFPRHGGFYIETWAQSYARTKNPQMLTAIETLVGYFEAHRDPHTGALSAEGKTPELMWPASNLSLAISLENAAPQVPDALAARMRALAASTDAVFFQMDHQLQPDGLGFIKTAVTSTLEPGSKATRNVAKKGFYTRTWATGYGDSTDANIAMMCLQRFEQTGDERYREMALQAAERYVVTAPDETIELYPQAFGEAIALLLGAHRLSGDDKYLARADELAKQAVALFWRDGSPLPLASNRIGHYEAITHADTLAMSLLQLWAAHNKPNAKLDLTWADR